MNIFEHFRQFCIEERSFIAKSFFVTTIPTFLNIKGVISLFDITKSGMATYTNHLETVFNRGLDLALGDEVSPEQW